MRIAYTLYLKFQLKATAAAARACSEQAQDDFENLKTLQERTLQEKVLTLRECAALQEKAKGLEKTLVAKTQARETY